MRSAQIAYLNFQSGNTGIVLDATDCGIGFQSVEPLKIGEPVFFRISAPGFPHVNLSGHVAWLDDSRTRGGLRFIIPAAERRAFQSWLQNGLGASFQADEMVPTSYGPEFASRQQFEADRDVAQTRNLLVGCLILALSMLVAGTVQFLLVRSGDGDLLTYFSRSKNGQPSADVAPQRATPPARNAPPDTAFPSMDPVTVDKRTPSQYRRPSSLTGQQRPSADGTGTGREASSFAANSRSDPAAAAKISTAIVTHAISNGSQAPSSLLPLSNTPLAQFQAIRHASDTYRSEARDAVPASHDIEAKPPEIVDNSTRPADPTSPSPPLAFAAQPPEAPNLPAPEPGANIEPCRLVSSVQPVYPKEARKRSVEGDVRLRIVVGTDGVVKSVSPFSGPSLLVAAAVDAAREFRYKPALLNGEPIETIQTIAISFKLSP